MQPKPGPEHQKSQNSGVPTQHAFWSVDLKLTHLDWSPEATLIHFQGQHPSICELDYHILQQELQNVPKTEAAVDIADFCLVEDVSSAQWFRGRVQNQKEDLLDVFLIDSGNILSVSVAHISSCTDDLFILPPKIVSGFLANVLLLQNCSHSVIEGYFSSLIGKNVTGFIQAVLPYKDVLLDAPNINSDLVKHGFGRHVDRDTFLLLVSLLTEVPLKQNMEPVLIEKSKGQEFCYKSSSLQGYKDILSFCGPKLSLRTRAKVRVTAAVNPGLFYCQMANAAAELLQFSKKLAEVCEDKTKGDSQKTSENLGVLCAVKGKDQKWYRGFVQLLSAHSQVRVFFIDYGFFDTAKVENVHRLPLEFYSAQIMAFPCQLPSLADQEMPFRTQQLSFLKAGLLGAVLDVEITGFDRDNYLYTIRMLSDKDSHEEEPKSIQNLPSESLSDVEELPPLVQYENYELAFCKTLEAEDVQIGSVFVGYVEYAQDPNHFWIRTQKRNQEFEEMMDKIVDHFGEMKLDEDVLLNPEVGAMCCALYEKDMHFYRGVVTDVLKHGAEILFIDYGNIEKVPHKLIKNIPKTIADACPFAICCTLVNVFPLDDVWPSMTCQLFRKAVSSKALLVHLIQMKKNTFVVDLFEIGSDNSISELLISSKLAEYIPHIPVEKNKDVLEKMRQRQHSEANTSKRSEKWQDCEGEVNQCKKETEKVKAHSNYKALTIKPGFEISVRCSHVNSPSDFWCQPLDGTPALEKLMDDIQLYYSAQTAPLQPEESCCVAKSPQDGKWYRGFIIGNRKSNATVMLVDYGSVIQVRDSHLQAIMPEYLRLEGQAFRCSLFNLIEPADPKYCSDWSPNACNLLKSFVRNSQDGLKCQVLSLLNVKNKGLCNVVSLHNTQTQQNIANTLTEQGHARVATLSTKQNSEVFLESFIYSSFDLSPGDEEQVYVTHVNSQCEVYCQLERNAEIIEELETKISQESENITQASTEGVVRKLCLAKYFDGKWYRVMMPPIQSSLHVGVFFVDYGNTEISEIKSIMSIPRSCEDLLYTPMQAVRFNLYSVPSEEISADALELLISTVLNKLLRAVLRGKRDDGSFDVELFDGDININEKVKELILSQKPKTAIRCAIRTTKTKKKNQHTKTTKGPFKSQMKGQCTAPSKAPIGTKFNNTKSPALSRSLNKYARTIKDSERNTNRSGPIKPQIKSTSGNQNIKSKQTQHRKKKERSQLVQFPDKNINPGFRAKCFVSHIDSFSSFFLQLSDDESAILKMAEDLNSSVFKDSLKIVSPWSVSDAVLSVFEEDSALYRSVVKKQEGSSRYKVEFVDYGNSAVVGKEKIYALPEKFLSQPRFSIPCSLINSSAYRDEASFIEAVIEKPLMVEFVWKYGNQWQVKVEVLDGEAESSTPSSTFVAESEEESPSLLSEFTENTGPCKENLREESHQSEKSIDAGSTLESKSLMPGPSAKQQVLTTRRVRRTCSGKKRYKKSKKLSVPVKKRDRPDRFLSQTIQVRDTETWTILSVQSNGSFYVRLTKNNNMLTSMERHITNNITEYKTVPEKDIKEDLKCLVQAEDGTWQRAVIQRIHERRLEVFLVDHGITKDIPRGPVPQQYTYLKKIPNLALLCKMNSFSISEGKAAHQCWYETLNPLVGTEVRLIFVGFSEADKVWLVEIVLSRLLLVDQIKASQQQSGEKTTLAAEPQSEILSDKFTADVSTQLVFLAPLEADQAYTGFATAVTTPFDFCVVLEDLHLIMNKVSIMLDNLLGNMPPLPEAHLVPGACCLLKFESKWCRAEIVHADTTVVLNLVDYGHHECIPYHDVSKLKQLPLELTNLQKTTYHCILRGVKPAGADGQWSDEAAVFFQHCLHQKNLQIFFKEFSSNSTWRVDILADGFHVAKKLVDAGHANYTDVLLGIRFQVLDSCKQPHVCGADEEEVCNEVEATDCCDGNSSVNTESRSSRCFLM